MAGASMQKNVFSHDSFTMCMCYYPESGGCSRYAVVNQKYCLFCLDEETNWACQCRCAGCPKSHAAVVSSNSKAGSSAVSFEAVLEEMEEALCRIVSFLGIDSGLHVLQLPEICMVRCISRRVYQVSSSKVEAKSCVVSFAAVLEDVDEHIV